MHLTGKQLKENFRVLESKGEIDFDMLYNLLKGGEDQRCVVYIVRDMMTTTDCEQFLSNFWNVHDQEKSYRDDQVFALQLGANQFGRTSQDYFKLIKETKFQIDGLFENLGNVKEQLFREDTLQQYFAEQGLVFRPSAYQGESVGICTARSWINDGALSLLAHEDLSQLGMAIKDGYEIGAVQQVIANQVCFSNTEGGELVLWDICPDQETKERLNTIDSGFPYPTELLTDFDRIEVKINARDMYFINVNFIHAVKQVTKGKRVSAGRFLGFSDENTLVYWT